MQVNPEGVAAFNRVFCGTGKGGKGQEDAALAACRALVDVDEHLDDAGKDFLNPQVAKLL